MRLDLSVLQRASQRVIDVCCDRVVIVVMHLFEASTGTDATVACSAAPPDGNGCKVCSVVPFVAPKHNSVSSNNCNNKVPSVQHFL